MTVPPPTPATAPTPAEETAPWLAAVQRLLAGLHTTTSDTLDAGAELRVADPEGAEVYLEALTRMCRHDPQEQTLWIRPVGGGQRRRALQYTAVAIVEEAGVQTVHLTLWNGQHAVIRSAAGERVRALQSWDEVAYNELDPAYLDELEQLRDDTAPDIPPVTTLSGPAPYEANSSCPHRLTSWQSAALPVMHHRQVDQGDGVAAFSTWSPGSTSRPAP